MQQRGYVVQVIQLEVQFASGNSYLDQGYAENCDEQVIQPWEEEIYFRCGDFDTIEEVQAALASSKRSLPRPFRTMRTRVAGSSDRMGQGHRRSRSSTSSFASHQRSA